MRNGMYENLWSPFDPKWYQKAFDKFVSTADQLFNQNEIISQGFVLPDADGSKSSVFRRDAILNNSFNETALRETLKDIYLNSSHKLVASNHDNVHFFQWNGTMNDVRFIPNTNMCEIVIPTEGFIFDKTRDKYKISQFYRKWIDITDIYNNWDIFKWNCLLFINQRIYSEYQLRIDDHETTIRFRYEDFWVKQNYPIYIYKFDSKYQCRSKITRQLMNNQWNWKVPIDYIDKRNLNSDHIIVAFNRINDQSIRSDGLFNVDILGDNLEFLTVKDGFIDLSEISDFNKRLINSESKEWLWMSIFVPKFLHEFPILIPTDIIYRPYQANMVPVFITANGAHQQVLMNESEIGEDKKVYINLDDKEVVWDDGWQYMIRPVVLADAFNVSEKDPYVTLSTDISYLRDLTIKGADLIETFRLFMMDYKEESFLSYCDSLEVIIKDIKECHDKFLNDRRIVPNTEYDDIYNQFIDLMITIRNEKNSSIYFHREHGKKLDFWSFISPLIYIPRNLVDKYYVTTIMSHINKSTVWEDFDQNMNKHRFRRPVDVSDFWTFEYDMDNNVWRPCILNIERHFPDVYLMNDPKEDNPTPNRIFKSFFFYSDTPNVVKQSEDIIRATYSWDKDVEEYEFENGSVYRDIFMEKFYWMGIKAIYKGIIVSNYRWEVLEYVKDNPSYERFNELFLNTMDPYFKMGLATYLKSDNFEFPFDEAVDKLNERINQDFIGYKRVNNFEMYLNKTWIPSYFDHIVKIMKDIDWSSKLIRRPRDSFDTKRLYPLLMNTQKQIHELVSELHTEIDWILNEIAMRDYDIDNIYLLQLKEYTTKLDLISIDSYEYINTLDMDIYSIDDVNDLANILDKYFDTINMIEYQFALLQQRTPGPTSAKDKLKIIEGIHNIILNEYNETVTIMGSMIQSFNIEEFMRAVNDPAFFNELNHKDDSSLIGMINQFTYQWPLYVQEARNELYVSTTKLWSKFDTTKSYQRHEIEEFVAIASKVSLDIYNLNETITQYWSETQTNGDEKIISHMEFATERISELVKDLDIFTIHQDNLIQLIDSIRMMIINTEPCGISEREDSFIETIDSKLDETVTSLSYLTGENKGEEAKSLYNNILSLTNEWEEYVRQEIIVLERIGSLAADPVLFLELINKLSNYNKSMIEYMRTVNNEFIPDIDTPSYSDIYEINQIELVTGGFNNKVGDEVFIPNLGSYRITSVSGEVATAESIDKLNYRNTSFRNPCWQSNLYDGITNGDGIGISVKAISATKQVIINDTLAERFVSRIKNVVYMITRDVEFINPHNNSYVENTISTIQDIQSEWENIQSFYVDYMSEGIKTSCVDMINSVSTILEDLNNFINVRSKNDLTTLLSDFENFIFTTYSLFESNRKNSPTYIYFDNRLRVVYNEGLEYRGNGTSWNDKDELINVLNNLEYELELFNRKIIKESSEMNGINNIITLYDSMIIMINNFKTNLDDTSSQQEIVRNKISEISSDIDNIPQEFHRDIWYNLQNVVVGKSGAGYDVGDIVELIPQLPNIYEEDQIFMIMNDVILIRITQVNDNGEVLKAEPLMNYAIPYLVWGVRETKTRVGNGSGLVVNVYANEVTLSDSKLFLDKSSDIILPKQFDQNDLLTFKFENIHDLPIDYEVFFAGKQMRDFIIRHESVNNHLYPQEIDVIYLNANEVLALGDSSIYTEGEHYFVYKLDSVEILDPGAGYTEGQEIIINTGQLALKLKVSKLTNDPLKGIAGIEMISNKTTFNGTDPTSDEAFVVKDTLNNIDDEFHVSEYDKLTAEGSTKGAAITLDPEDYPFTSRRFDDLEDGDRNKTFMYPDVENVTDIHGDPDNGTYLGSRIDNSEHPMSDSREWNGIMNTISPADPIIPVENRVPTSKPIKGEYQDIKQLRIHNSEIPKIESLTEEYIADLVDGSIDASEPGPFEVHGKSIEGIPDEDVIGMIEGTYVPKGTPTVTVDGEIIKAIDFTKVRDLIYGNIEGVENPGAYMDTCLVSSDITDINDKIINNYAMISGDITVQTYASIPKHIDEWPETSVGKTVIVENDETHEGHRMIYRVRTFVVSGYIIYDEPEIADYKWNYFDIDWMKVDFYPDFPTLKAQYPSDKWRESTLYRIVQRDIRDEKIQRVVTPRVHEGSYIHDLTIDDLSVYNFTEQRWEDLYDENRWKLEVRNDSEKNDYGFRLTFLEDGYYDYNMRLYLNKIPETQMRNAELKRPATFKIVASICGEVNTHNTNYSINTGRDLRIRKLFPYEQKETFTIGGKDENGNLLGYEMNFKLANYIHYKNEIHLEDIKIYNKSADRFENVMDPKMFEVRFKDDRAVSRGYETQTVIIQSLISKVGESFTDGNVWGWNEEYGIHIFGTITADFLNEGHMLTFTPLHCPNPPKEDISIEFDIYQHDCQTEYQCGKVVIEFQTQKVEVWGDGYQHNVSNPMAPVPREFKIICQYDLDEPTEYEVIVNKTSQKWTFVEDSYKVFPTFHLPDVNIQHDRLYIMTDKGRFPLVNPSTYKPSMNVVQGEHGTDVTFLNLYNKNEHLEIHAVPYSMKSVYVQRRVPSHGFIDLKGKINKPLNKKYFEFWMNGRLLFDEVTIISPTKIFLHGLKSLRNFEIIEIDRDPNEYFSDNFLTVEKNEYGRPYRVWDFTTYLDDALEGNLEGDNYTPEEQEYLLTPVWKQVEREHPEFKNFPPNQDLEADILLRIDDYTEFKDVDVPGYQFTVINVPTIEGVPITGRTLRFSQFGFLPITESMIIDMLNQEWAAEIAAGQIPDHSIVSEDEWYGISVRMYNEYGDLVHSLEEAAYYIFDDDLLRINTNTNISRIVQKTIEYDLS